MRRVTRSVQVGRIVIGGDAPVAIQSMTATKTTDVAATVGMMRALAAAGGDIIRVAVDSPRDVDALREIRAEIPEIALAVDLQENWKLAEKVAPLVDKIRYNPGHLHHADAQKTWQEKVTWLVALAREHSCALRVGVNCGSLDPTLSAAESSEKKTALASAVAHSRYLDSLGFINYCVSLKDSDPQKVIAANRAFAALCPEVPLHLGVTEAGIPPEGILKSRLALEPLLASGIGETLRVSLTVPNERKSEEIAAGKEILANVACGDILTETQILTAQGSLPKLNLISCPSCARVENEAFVALAEKVRDATRFAENENLTIAVMGCRVNGPGETDHADFGIWCGAQQVTLKRKTEKLGDYDYNEVIPQLVALIKKQLAGSAMPNLNCQITSN